MGCLITIQTNWQNHRLMVEWVSTSIINIKLCTCKSDCTGFANITFFTMGMYKCTYMQNNISNIWKLLYQEKCKYSQGYKLTLNFSQWVSVNAHKSNMSNSWKFLSNGFSKKHMHDKTVFEWDNKYINSLKLLINISMTKEVKELYRRKSVADISHKQKNENLC